MVYCSLCVNVFRVYYILWYAVVSMSWYVFKFVKRGPGAELGSRWPLPQCLLTGTQLLEVLWVWGGSYCHYHYIKKQTKYKHKNKSQELVKHYNRIIQLT